MGNEESKKANDKGVVVTEEEVEGSEDGQYTQPLRIKQKNAGQKDEDKGSIVMSGGSVDLSSTAPTTANSDDKAFTTTNSPSEDNAIETRSPYRYGSPVLPVLPVRTSRDQVPKALSPSSTHIFAVWCILKDHAITVSDMQATHHFHAGTPLAKPH
jgi:hypothetical protein